jgi:hypothetical protein
LSSWFAAVALSYALIDNPDGKEKLLNVKLASNDPNPPTLLQQIVSSIQTVCYMNISLSGLGIFMLKKL